MVKKTAMNKLKIIGALFAIVMAGCTGFRPFNDEEAIKIMINQPDQVVMGTDFWDGPSDCSARAYLNKTNSTLLFTIEVYDDSLRTGAPESYMNDGVELYFDFRPPRLRENNFYQRGVFQAVILPEPGKKQLAPIEWFPKSYDSEIPGTRAYTELRDSGYVVQVSIPYSSLERNHYWPRNSFYMDVAINDADTGRRESQVMWAGGRDNWNNPHNFKQVAFKETLRQQETDDSRPNIVFIFTDQQTMSAMSAYGNKFIHTPYMDDLAKFGVRFTESYCTSPVCSPSRSSLITGMMPHQTGVNYNDQKPDSTLKNIGELLRKEGYETVWGGKWHLPESYPHTSKSSVPGFSLLDFLEEEKTTGRGDDTDEPLANEVVKYLKGRVKQPFFLAVSFHNPHDICYVPQNPDAFPYPANMESAPPLPGNFSINPLEPEFLKDARARTSYGNEIAFTHDFSRNDWRNYLHHYYRMTERADREIGKIIKALESEGMDENTIIIFTSDHGDGAASHQWAAKLSLYEESVKVPLILTWFGKTPENVVDTEHLVSGLDIAPTILDYAGAEIPARMKGYSLKALIENPDTTWRDFLVTQLAIDPSDSSKTARMITDGRYKYNLYSYGARNEQLFDLKNDPGEKINLAYSASLASVKRELRSKLMEWIEETGDYFKVEE
jgi:arylsulfatase A-like enzyme